MNPVFLERWSPRAFSDQPVSDDDLAAVFEAVRWTPSWMNNQPWYIAYATQDPDRQAILDTFMEFNRDWAAAAPVVGLVVAKTDLEGRMASTRDYDTGAAMMALSIQATMLGLSIHQLGGIELDDAHKLLDLDPEVGSVLTGFALGHRGDPAQLPEKQQAKEQPSDRKPVSDFVVEGTTLPF